MRADEALKKIFPTGKAPLVEITFQDGRPPLLLAESAHIVNYLIKYYSKGKVLIPDNEEGEEQVDFLTHFTEGSIQPYLTFVAVLDVALKKTPFLLKSAITKYNHAIENNYSLEETKANFKVLEGILAKNAASATPASLFFVQNKISAADIMLQFCVHLVMNGRLPNFDKSQYPNVKKWLDQVEQRPAFKRALKKIDGEGSGQFKVQL